MNLFGRKKKEAPPPRLAESIQSLREAQQMLDKREKHLEKQCADARAGAKDKLRAKDKRGAIYLLKRSKMIETQINQIYGKRQNLDVQIMALEGAASNKEIFDVMKSGKVALQSATASTKVEDVENVMADVADAISDADEVNDALAQPIGPLMDEDELENELKAMQGEMDDQQLLDVPAVPISSVRPITTPTAVTTPTTVPTMPSAPTRPVVVTNPTAPKPRLDDKEARELKELEAIMQT